MAAVYFGTASPSSLALRPRAQGRVTREDTRRAGEVSKLPADFVEQEITKLTTWEMQTFGHNLDITRRSSKMIIANYGLQAKIITDVTEDNIKRTGAKPFGFTASQRTAPRKPQLQTTRAQNIICW